jgi:hypothetical protein
MSMCLICAVLRVYCYSPWLFYCQVRRLALLRRVGQHRLHPQPLRHLTRPLLGHHRPHDLPGQDDGHQIRGPDLPRLGLLVGHIVSGHRLVAGDGHRPAATVAVPVYRRYRLPGDDVIKLFFVAVISKLERFSLTILLAWSNI